MLERLIEEIVNEELALLERQRAKPEIMYHGTSSTNVASILKKGMIPDPTEGPWKKDVTLNTSLNSPSLVSLKGSYWTTNLMTAISSASDARRKSGREGAQNAYIIAQIVPKTGLSDEDDIRNTADRCFRTATSKEFGWPDVDALAVRVKAAIENDPALYQNLVEEFGDLLHKSLRTSEKQPTDKGMMKKAFDAILNRYLSHVKWDSSGWTRADRLYTDTYERYYGSRTNDWEEARKVSEEIYKNKSYPKVSIQEGEQGFLDALDVLSSRYRKFTLDKSSFSRNLRVPDVVGFSGRNKILAIVIGDSKKLQVVYGTIPQQFINDYGQGWGPNFEVVDRKGNVVFKSSKLKEGPESRAAFAKDITPHLPKDLQSGKVYSQTIESIEKMLKHGRTIKQIFAKHADQRWIQTLTKVHYVKSLKSLLQLLSSGTVSSKDELSCMAYLPNQPLQNVSWGSVGVVVNGHITLLANNMDNLFTGKGEEYTLHNPERTKQSGANKGVGVLYSPQAYELDKILIFDKEDWDEHRKLIRNEALVDNWKPLAVIVSTNKDPYRMFAHNDKSVEEVKAVLKKNNINIPCMSIEEFNKRNR